MIKVLCCACLMLVSGLAVAQAQPAATHTLYVIRHGAYIADRNADPQLGPGITALGVAQARLIAARLSGTGIAFDSMTSSTMQRARDTAAVMHETLANVPFAQSALLRECTPPVLEAAEGAAADEQAACAKQLDQAFAQYFTVAKNTNRNDILVAHGNVIRYLVTRALKVDTRAWAGMTMPHASLTVIRVQPDGSAKVLAVGDSGHIPGPLLSWGDASDRQLVVPTR